MRCRNRIRQTEVLVYAIGIDASGSSASSYNNLPAQSSSNSGSGSSSSTPQKSVPVPAAFPGAPVIRTPPKPGNPQPSASSPVPGHRTSSGERFNADALRSLTDDSGGRTEIILSARDLDPATAGIAERAQPAVFHRLQHVGAEGRPLAQSRSESEKGELRHPRAQRVYCELGRRRRPRSPDESSRIQVSTFRFQRVSDAYIASLT